MKFNANDRFKNIKSSVYNLQSLHPCFWSAGNSAKAKKKKWDNIPHDSIVEENLWY